MKSLFSTFSLALLLSMSSVSHAGGEVVGGIVIASIVGKIFPVSVKVELPPNELEQDALLGLISGRLKILAQEDLVGAVDRFERDGQINLCVYTRLYDHEQVTRELLMLAPALITQGDASECQTPSSSHKPSSK